jgi:hypothetical protein
MTIGSDYIARLLVEERIGRLHDEAAARRLARLVAPEGRPPRRLRRAAAYLRSRSRRSRPLATTARVLS